MSEQLRLMLDLARDATSLAVKVRYINGQELPEWQHGPSLSYYISELAEEGWTLSGSACPTTFIFERMGHISHN